MLTRYSPPPPQRRRSLLSKRIRVISIVFLLSLTFSAIFTPNPVRKAIATAVVTAVAPPAEVAQLIFPLAIAPSEVRVTSEYGPRSSVKTSGGQTSSFHKGIDFACATGEPLIAVEGGTVVYLNDPNGWGNAIIIRSHGGDEFLYAHTTERIAGNGKLIAAGEAIATCGTSGNSTGPHLHFEFWPKSGDPINPRPYLEDRGLPKKP